MKAKAPTEIGPVSLDDFATIEGMVAEHPKILTENALRWYLRFRETNGLAPGVVRYGRRLLVNKPYFARWLANGGAGSK